MTEPIDLLYAPLTISDVEAALRRRWEATGRSFRFLLTCSPATHRIVSSFIEWDRRTGPVSLIQTHFGLLTIFSSDAMPNNHIALYENVPAGPFAVIVNFDPDPASYPWL